MSTLPATKFGKFLSQAQAATNADTLAASFYFQSAIFQLEGVGSSAPSAIGAHIRRSFWGALGPGASERARNGFPCDWDPPCALDIFCREQMRGPKGDGLPKPFVIETARVGADLHVTLHVFGMANDWFMVAVEAMANGLRTILPWARMFPGRNTAPAIISREVNLGALRVLPADINAVSLNFTSPTDTAGRDQDKEPHRILTRLQRRVDAVSRWNGLALDDDAGRAAAARMKSYSFDTSGLVCGKHDSPNAQGQARRKKTMTGVLKISGDIPAIWPILAMGEICHLGRGAVEGLGKFSIET